MLIYSFVKYSRMSSTACLISCKPSVISPNTYPTTFKTSICDTSILLPKCLMINCDKNIPQSISHTSVCFCKDRGKTLSIVVKCNVNIPSIDGEIRLAMFFSLAY